MNSPDVRANITKLINKLPMRESSKRGDLFVFTSHRSGNTWLSEMFAELPYSRIIKEPFSPAKIPMMKNFFEPRRVYLDLSANESGKIVDYLCEIQKNNVMRLGYHPLSKDYKLITTINIFSMTYVSNLAPLVEKELGGRILYLVRHPIAQALSKLRNQYHESEAYGESGWYEFIDVYLNSEKYAEKYLDDSLINYCWDLLRSANDLEKYILHWCFENIALFTMIKDSNWLLVAYEDLVTNLAETLNRIGKHYHLPLSKWMSRRRNVPSTSTTMSTELTKEQIKDGNPNYLVYRWKNSVTADEIKTCFQILNRFGIDLYLPGDFISNNKYEYLKLPR